MRAFLHVASQHFGVRHIVAAKYVAKLTNAGLHCLSCRLITQSMKRNLNDKGIENAEKALTQCGVWRRNEIERLVAWRSISGEISCGEMATAKACRRLTIMA